MMTMAIPYLVTTNSYIEGYIVTTPPHQLYQLINKIVVINKTTPNDKALALRKLISPTRNTNRYLTSTSCNISRLKAHSLMWYIIG